MRRCFIAFLLIAILIPHAEAQNVPRPRDLIPLCDTLSVRMGERTGVMTKLAVKKVLRRGNSLDLQFSNTFSDYPWHSDDVKYFREQLEKEWPSYVKGFKVGKTYTRHNTLDELITPRISYDGSPAQYNLATDDPRPEDGKCFVTRKDARYYRRGLSGRHIALWQSHGRYWEEKDSVWKWQRCALHRTIEDMLTQSFVLPFLIPMLENAGAYVMTPRERDTQWREHVVDNDNSFPGPRTGRLRKDGIYEEVGIWKNGGPGFADRMERYSIDSRPFTYGTTRTISCSGKKPKANIKWTPIIEERGSYAVYISYESTPTSCHNAHYSVKHLGGTAEFYVDQSIGGSTWIYLGTFEFDKGTAGYVSLDNSGPTGRTVSADAVRFGGGMGKVERGGTLSGLPAYAEGALYSMIWAGIDDSVTHGWDREYTNDFASRGLWTKMMKDKKGVPFDISLAFHTDAGITPNDSTIGTLAIYTYLCDGEKKYSDGRSRMVSRLLADYVQEQVVHDIRAGFEPEWQRRELWDRSYSEARVTGVPGIILELLSHQNFADMKQGLDPAFRFTTSRAVYKGILKTLSTFHNTPYVVQPLPVHGMALTFGNSRKVRLSWKETIDSLETTARASSYIVYTRVDDAPFDQGVEVKSCFYETNIENGHIYSFKVCALNDGGISFPSETLSIGRPSANSREVLIVNNFDRIGPPSWVDLPSYGGFQGWLDSGVPYISDLSYVGENYEFHKDVEYVNDDEPGFGASVSDHAAGIVAGNTFDYPYVHGKTLLSLGYAFSSVSSEAFCEGMLCSAKILDFICGKQRTSTIGSGALPCRYKVFPDEIKAALKNWCGQGRNVILSGANIASDEKGTGFTENLFGYRYLASCGTAAGMLEDMPFHSKVNQECYCVESPDALEPADSRASTILSYPVSHSSAAVFYKTKTYKTVSIGVPIETIKSEQDRIRLLQLCLSCFER